MKKNLLIWLGLMWIGCAVRLSAQERHEKFSPQEYARQMESFISKEAGLSQAEATAFFPIFHEMHKKQREINRKIGELKKRVLPADAPDKDYSQLIKEINSLKVESAELEAAYYEKMCKAVPARKVHAVMKAEDNFHRRMLRKFSKPDGQSHKK